ncbi:MAG TPA: ATP-binding cassette domain-containing protein [Candidatus Omnitrophota bacterium]|nr:ATP-binding cassette domain-containing protein [Candidatus Omnitrophota bacterium]HPT07710.1 ATP-binding cassette domain-containing protein [Candidatus Omnitrophota bacterium]
MSLPLLEFNNVTVLKGRNAKVLDSISITVALGEHVAILGPNGAGKSSFIKTITREYYPVSNAQGFKFRIWGEDRWNIFDLRLLLGIVSNDLQAMCASEISGLDIVLSGFFSSIGLYKPRVTMKMKKKAYETLKFLEIYHLRDRKMNELSSGEARRFLIGRALVHDPKALILDEPANSLDLHALRKFRDIVSKIARSGISIILVTHNIQEIVPEISRVILMNKGKFYNDGPKELMLTSARISKLFSTRVEVMKKNGFYYALQS